MRSLIILVLLVLLTGCAVVPATPYHTYGPYYGSPYYSSPVYGYYYGPGYYGPYHFDGHHGYYVPRHHEDHHGGREEGRS